MFEARDRIGAALLVVLTASCVALEPGEGSVTPQRPTLSSDTATTVEGTVELEVGGRWERDTGSDVPTTLKYGAGPATEVFLDGSPLVHDDEADETGFGDVALGVRHRVRDETGGAPAVAVAGKVKFPTASRSDGLGTGELDASLAGIVQKTVGVFPLVGYYSFDVLGDPTGGADVGHSLALASGTPAWGRLAGFAEVAGVFVPEQKTDEVFTTLGATWSASHLLVLDAGVVLGLSDDAPDFQVVFGLTHNFGRFR